MYRCDVCDSVVPANTPAERVTVETRVIEHPHRPKAHWQPPRPPATKGKRVDDPGGTGTAIVREAIVCARCAEKPPPHEA
jgi:hypothetical protein